MKETRFKDTEIGRIPEDWKSVSLGDIGEVKMCKRVMKYQTSDKGDIPFYKIGTFGRQPDAFISRCLYESYRNKYNYPKQGDILLSAAGTIGRTVIFDGKPSYFQDSNIVWIANDEKILSNELLFYIYKQLSWVTESGTIPRIYNGIVRSIKFAIPTSKEEQSRIASALTSIDNLISSLDKLIEKKKDIKQGTMQQLLTGKKRLKGFTEPWDYVTLGQVGYFEGHSVNPSQYPNDAFTEYSMPAFDAGQSPNTLQGFEMLSSRVSIDGEVLLINKLNVRQKRIWHIKNCESNAVCSGEFLPYKSEKLNLSFLRHLMLTDKVVQDFMDMSTGTSNSQKRVRPINVLNYKIYIPVDRNEQYAIASFLDSLDNEIISIRAKKNKYESLKQGMMQQLLTGKIRLV